MATEISECSCKFPYQDRLYGEGMKLHDLKMAPKCVPVWTCSHCGKTKINYSRGGS